MAALVVQLRPSTAPLRCAACHDDLPARRWTCGGCGTALHPACAGDLRRCPTRGCPALPPQAPRRVEPWTPAPPPPTARSVWLVPGLLALGSPLTFGLLFVVASFRDRYLGLCLSLAVLTPLLVGHLVLAPLADSRGVPGSHHARALAGTVGGFVALALVVGGVLLSAC